MGDPRFVAPAAGNYRIGPGSAARNSGANAGVVVDCFGDPRLKGAGLDIGHDEVVARVYVPSVSHDVAANW